MYKLAKLISFTALAATVVPCLLYFGGAISHAAVNWSALAGTVLWFAATPLWMGRDLPSDVSQSEA